MRTLAAGSILLVLAASLLPPSSAYADRGGGTRLDCPVCGDEVYGPYSNIFPGLGIRLRDPQLMGLPRRAYAMWTCSHCRFSTWASKFKKGAKAETKNRLLAERTAPALDEKRSLYVPTRTRYELAARVLAYDGASAADRGTLLIAGSWEVRQNAEPMRHAVIRDKLFGDRFEQALESAKQQARSVRVPAGEKLLWSLVAKEAKAAAAERAANEARDAGAPDPILTLAAAYLQRLVGENNVATRQLAAIDKATAPHVIRDAANKLAKSMAEERALQERALPLLLEGVQTPPENGGARAWARITVADTLRRLDRAPEATAWFLKAVNDQEAPVWAVALARHGLVKTRAMDKYVGLLAKADARAREVLRKQLAHPKMTKQVALLVGYLGDKSFFPDLRTALNSEHKQVRRLALLALRLIHELELPPGILDTLGRMVLDENESHNIREFAMFRLRDEASLASLPVFRAGLDDNSHEIRGYCVDGLARCGETEDVPRLLAILTRETDTLKPSARRGLLLALSCLASRDLVNAKDAATWWASAKDRERTAWVRESFEEAGVTLRLPLSLKSVPGLFQVLDAGETLDRPWVTWNALRILRDLTGCQIGWNVHFNSWGTKSARQHKGFWSDWHKRRHLLDDWKAWWATQSAERKPIK